MLAQQSILFLRRISLPVLLVATLAACQSGNDSSGKDNDPSAAAPGTPTLAEGYVVKGPVSSSQVLIYALNSAGGSRGDLVAGPFFTDSAGYWSGMVPESDQPYEVVSTGGAYIDEATGKQVIRSHGNAQDTLSGVLDFTKSRLAIVTPLTAVALRAAKHRASHFHVPISNAVDTAFFDMELAFDIDLSTTIPDLEGSGVGAALTNEQRYGALLGGFSMLANSPALANVATAPVHEIRNALISDLADGRLDGYSAEANPIMVRLNDDEQANFPSLSSDDIGAYLTAANAYAQTKDFLAQFFTDPKTILAFNSDGGRMLGDGLNVVAPEGTYLAFNMGNERVYRQQATLQFDEIGNVVDEHGNKIVILIVDSASAPSGTAWTLLINAGRYLLNSTDIDTKGKVRAKSNLSALNYFGQIVVAVFPSPANLEEVSPGIWQETAASGSPFIAIPLKEATIGELKILP